MTSERASIVTVQRSAIEHALVDGDDARQYLALAGMLDAAIETSGAQVQSSDSDAHIPAPDTNDVLSTALLSLAVVSNLDDGPPLASSPITPWTPGREPSQSAVRRGAELAVQWFDVPAEQVATRAGLPTAVLTKRE